MSCCWVAFRLHANTYQRHGYVFAQTEEKIAERKASYQDAIIEKAYGANISQTQYEAYSKQIAGWICHAIANHQLSLQMTPGDPNVSPQPLTLFRLGMMRNHIAELAGTKDLVEFGKLRESDLTTPHGERYQPYFTEFLLRTIPAYQGNPQEDYVKTGRLVFMQQSWEKR